MLNYRTIVAAIRDGSWITPERVRLYTRLFVATFLVGLTWLAFNPTGPRWSGSDFVGFWVPAHLATLGRAASIYDQHLFAALQQAVSGRNDMYLPWVYPPSFLLLILPLGALPYMAALLVWLTTGLAVYWAALRKLAGREGMVAAFAFPGVIICIYNGHSEILLAGLFGGALLLLDRGPWIAGLLIGLCSVKPHLFLLVPVALAAGARWRVIVSATAFTLLAAAISAAVFGTELWRDFFISISGLGDGAVRDGTSFHAVLAKQQSAFAFGLRFEGLVLGLSLQAIAMAVAGCAVAVTWAKDRPLEDRALVLCCGTLLSSPYLFDYDLALLAVPIALLARAGLAKGFAPWRKSLLVALWAAPALARPCSYYVDLPVALALMVLSIGVVMLPSARQGRDAPATDFSGRQNHIRRLVPPVIDSAVDL